MSSSRFESPAYPPRNREADLLPILELRIEDARQTHVLDPNGLVMGAAKNTLPLDGPPIGPSAISGRPGLRWREDDIAVLLAPDEIRRLARRALLPEEYKELRRLFGLFFSVHEDFYDPASGAALQPVES